MAKTRSAKGEIVDFDLLKIRQKLQQKPITLDVKAREDFIDKKIRRRNRKVKQAAAQSGPVDSPELLNVQTPEPGKLIDQPKAQEKKPVEQPKIDNRKNSKQKHRPPVR